MTVRPREHAFNKLAPFGLGRVDATGRAAKDFRQRKVPQFDSSPDIDSTEVTAAVKLPRRGDPQKAEHETMVPLVLNARVVEFAHPADEIGDRKRQAAH